MARILAALLLVLICVAVAGGYFWQRSGKPLMEWLSLIDPENTQSLAMQRLAIDPSVTLQTDALPFDRFEVGPKAWRGSVVGARDAEVRRLLVVDYRERDGIPGYSSGDSSSGQAEYGLLEEGAMRGSHLVSAFSDDQRHVDFTLKAQGQPDARRTILDPIRLDPPAQDWRHLIVLHEIGLELTWRPLEQGIEFRAESNPPDETPERAIDELVVMGSHQPHVSGNLPDGARQVLLPLEDLGITAGSGEELRSEVWVTGLLDPDAPLRIRIHVTRV